MVLKSAPIPTTRASHLEEMVRGVRYRYRSIRTLRAKAILQVQHHLTRAIRQSLDSLRFVEALAPINGPITDPSIRGAKAVPVTFYGEAYVLMTSMILYKQMAVSSFPRVYSFSPNVRLEPVESQKTGSHLAEFFQVDLELAHGTCTDVMTHGDRILFEVIRSVQRECNLQLEFLGRTLPLALQQLLRTTHAEALEILQTEGKQIDPHQESPWEAEQKLSQQFEAPF